MYQNKKTILLIDDAEFEAIQPLRNFILNIIFYLKKLENPRLKIPHSYKQYHFKKLSLHLRFFHVDKYFVYFIKIRRIQITINRLSFSDVI